MNRSFSHVQAILFAIAGFTFWVFADAFIKLAAEAAIPLHEIVAVFGLTRMVTIGVKVLRRGSMRDLRPSRPLKHLFYGALTLSNILTCALALKHLPFTLFYIIVFTAPMVLSVLGAIILHEHLTLGKIISVIIGFTGVVIAINPLHNAADNMHGDWIGYVSLAVNLLGFVTVMLLQRSVMQSESSDSLAFTQTLSQTLGGSIWMFFSHTPLSPYLILILIGGGIFNTAGNFCNIIATKNTTAATVAQFHYTQIIAGGIIGYTIWHEIPNLNLITGSAIIIASGLYIANHMRKATLAPGVKPP